MAPNIFINKEWSIVAINAAKPDSSSLSSRALPIDVVPVGDVEPLDNGGLGLVLVSDEERTKSGEAARTPAPTAGRESDCPGAGMGFLATSVRKVCIWASGHP